MTVYEKTLIFWQEKNIRTDAELAEALNGHSIAFAYNSGKIENENITYNDTREIMEIEGSTYEIVVAITSHSGKVTELMIPSSVTGIGASAFIECGKFEKMEKEQNL